MLFLYFMILFGRFLAFFSLSFFVVFKSKTQNCWNVRESDGWLYIRIVQIIKFKIVNMNLDFKIRNAQEHFWKFYKMRRRLLDAKSNSPAFITALIRCIHFYSKQDHILYSQNKHILLAFSSLGSLYFEIGRS